MPAKPPYTKRWQMQDLAEAIRQIGRIDAEHRDDGRNTYRENAQRSGQRKLGGSVGDVHPPPLPPGVAAGLAIQQHGKGRAGRTDEDGPGGTHDAPRREADGHEHHELKPSATLAETQSRLASNGSEARNAPNRRYTGLIEARNRERLAGLASSTRSFTWLTGTSVVSTASWGDARRAAMVAATSSPRPCGLRVGTSSTTRAPNAVTSSRSWVTTTMLTPSERKSWISRTICIQVRLSCPKVGSSNSSTFGAEASAEATVSLRFSPPDNVYGLTCAYWSRWNLLSELCPVRAPAPQPFPCAVGRA